MFRAGTLWTDPRTRHWLMQAVLCALLVGMLGLALVVRNHRLHLLHVKLEAPIAAGPFLVRWPGGWELRGTQYGAVLLEPSDGDNEGQRRLEITLVPAVGFISPLELLVRTDLLDERDASVLPSLEGAEAGGLKPLRIAGWPGMSVTLTRQYAGGRESAPVFRKQTLACTVLPSGDAIVMRLEGRGLADVSDEHVIDRVARSLQLKDRPAVARGGELHLGDEVTVRTPETLATFESADPFRIGRVLLADREPHWLAAELVPCLFIEEQPDPASSFLAMLHLRDPLLKWKAPRRLDEQTWVSDREAEAGGAFPARAYLRSDKSGHALLGEFRWVPGPADVAGKTDQLWEALAGPVKFPEEANLRRLLEAGRLAVASLPADAVEVLNTRPEERWQWYHESTPRSSMGTFRYDANEQYLNGDVELEKSPPLASLGWESRRWRLWRDWSRYVYQMTRTSSGAAFSYETRVEGKQIRMTVRSGADTVTTVTTTRTPLFVPGAVLPLVLGRLKPEPMVLMTDALPSPLTGSFAGMLTLRLEPAGDVKKQSPDGEGPMSAWSVRVNGSGQSSRWYYDRDKRLESISFAGKVHFHRVEREDEAPATQPATLPTSMPATIPATRSITEPHAGKNQPSP